MLIRAELKENLTFDDAKLSINQILEEEKDPLSGDTIKKKNLYLNGIFIQSEAENHNGRIYPLSEIKKAVADINKKIDQNQGVPGEADHPEELTINIDRISHVITKMWMEGNDGMGRLKILETPKGQIIRTIIESGLRLGVSSRGVGNVDDNGRVSQFEIVTVDIVVNPSAKQAYPKPFFESIDSKRHRVITDLAEAVAHDRAAQRHLTRQIMEAIKRL